MTGQASGSPDRSKVCRRITPQKTMPARRHSTRQAQEWSSFSRILFKLADTVQQSSSLPIPALSAPRSYSEPHWLVLSASPINRYM
ncbi:hypothetical protein DL89DRAFT_264782, partial [Linderina pennispora]